MRWLVAALVLGACAPSSSDLPALDAGRVSPIGWTDAHNVAYGLPLAKGAPVVPRDEAAAFLSTFFNGLVIDLDGCELTFSTLDVSAVELSLGLAVCVRKFPSPFINF